MIYVTKVMYINGLVFFTGTILASAYDDLSKRRNVTQSTTFPAGEYAMYKAGNAVDRNMTTCMRTDAVGKNSHDQTVWWMVDLGGVYNIYSVNIVFKNYGGYDIRQRGRFAGFSLYTSNTGDIDNSSLCYKDGPQLPPLNFTTTCITSGRYVIFYNERSHDVTYPAGYELSVVVTELRCQTSGVYGDSCQKRCPISCRNNTCHIKTGTCFECEPGWKGPTCNTVSGCLGWYGDDCQYPCSKHCVNQTCDRFNGSCLDVCDSRYHGAKCDQEYASPRESVSRLSTVASGILGATVLPCVLIATAVVVFIVRRKKLCIFSKNITSTADSPYADIENQPSGESTYQELTESDMNKDYHNLALQ